MPLSQSLPCHSGGAVNVNQSHIAIARVLGSFSHATYHPISCALRACFLDRSAGGPCEAWWKGRPSLLFQPREILLRVEGGGRAVGGGGRQLVDLLDTDIAGGKDPRDLRAAVLTRRDIARLREG